jgi:hypothetical protein
MAKTTVSQIITDIKTLGDYNITDTSLDTLVLKCLNYAFRNVRNWMCQFGIWEGVTTTASFKTIANQNYVDLTKAHIVGDATTFTPVALDSITVTIDGTGYTVLMAGCTTITLVASAINVAVGSTVASVDDNGYLMITSPTTGTTSSVTIANLVGTPATRLFSVAAERTQSAITDMLDIIKVVDRGNDRFLEYIPYQRLAEMYPDPASNSTTTPDYVSRMGEYIYFGPTPSSAILLYYTYIKTVAELTSADTMPIDSDYDELIIAKSLEWLYSFLDSKDRSSILTAKERVAELRKTLIVDSPKRIGLIRQSALRGDALDLTAINPRKAE